MVTFSLCVVRHGESVGNERGVLQGQKDFPLSSFGKEQADALGRTLRGESFTHVFSSDLQRAQQTAAAVLREQSDSQLKLLIDRRLRERCYGCLEGEPLDQLIASAKADNKSVYDFVPTNGETTTQLRSRILEFFLQLCVNLEKLYLASTAINNDAFLNFNQNSSGHKSSVSVNKPCRRSSSLLMVSESNETFENPFSCSAESAFTETSSNCCDETVTENGQCFNNNAAILCQCENAINLTTLPLLPQSSSVDVTAVPNVSPFTSRKNESNGIFEVETNCPQNLNGCVPNFQRSNSACGRKQSTISVASDDSSFLETEAAFSVLIVAHAGPVRELIKLFIDEYSCEVPGGRGAVLRRTPNTAVSSFLVTVDSNSTFFLNSNNCPEINSKLEKTGSNLSEVKQQRELSIQLFCKCLYNNDHLKQLAVARADQITI